MFVKENPDRKKKCLVIEHSCDEVVSECYFRKKNHNSDGSRFHLVVLTVDSKQKIKMKTQNIMAYSYENGICMKTVSEFHVFLSEFILCQTKSFHAAPHCFTAEIAELRHLRFPIVEQFQ